MSAKPTIVHLCHWDPKFIPPFIAFINERFDPSEHLFVIYGAPPAEISATPNARRVAEQKLGIGELHRMRSEVTAARRVIVHGLFNNRVASLLASVPHKLHGCRWVLWGGDLYDRDRLPRDARWHAANIVRRAAIARLGGIAALMPGDVALVRSRFGFRGTHFPCLGYPSNVFRGAMASDREPPLPTILVGNSATPSNRHSEAFKRLSETVRSDFKIICPLSYGDPSYAANVQAEGTAMFGTRFVALREFLAPGEYKRVLDSVDVAVFCHDRQQGVGNCVQLLGRGVRLHLNASTTHFAHFRSEGFPVATLDEIDLQTLDKEARQRSHQLACSLYSESRLESQYRDLFDYH